MGYVTLEQYISRKRRRNTCITIFGILISTSMIAALIAVYHYSGPIVLGTEMNTNGLVEYLCLGRGCEDYAAMH